MESNTIALKLTTQSFKDKNINLSINGFIINIGKKKYIISIHHNLPISSISELSSDNSLKVKINSAWSEIVVLSTTNIDTSNYVIHTKSQKHLPKENDLLIIKHCDKRYECIVVGHTFVPYNNLSNNNRIPYIIALLNIKENVAGLSGCPVYINDKLVGIFSKYDKVNSHVYIIPIYLVIKNFEKKDNFNIYNLPSTNIKKINTYHVKSNETYHPTLKINIPLDCYCLLEGDLDKTVLVQYNDETTDVDFEINNNLKISNEPAIISRNNNLEYKLNCRLLTLLKKFNMDIEIIKYLLIEIQKSQLNDIWISIIDKKIKVI